jgi:hypothetical protein
MKRIREAVMEGRYGEFVREFRSGPEGVAQ